MAIVGKIYNKCCTNYYCCKDKYINKACNESKTLKIDFLENAFIKCIKELKECINTCDFNEVIFLKSVLKNYQAQNEFDPDLFKRIVKYVLIGNYGLSPYSMRFVFKDIDDEIFHDYKLSREKIITPYSYKEIFSKFINLNIRFLDENRNFRNMSKIKISAKVIGWR